MTPPAAAATAAGRSRTRRPPSTTAPRTARRVSGPSGPPLHGSVSLPRGGALAPPLGVRLARRVAALPDARLLDRLIRGRLWIALLGVGLIGIVFMQISLLKLNTGIGRAVQTAQTLDQQNASMRAELSRMAGGARVQDGAKAMGYVLPATGQPRFLDARGVRGTRAAAGITRPAPVQQLPLGMIPVAQGGTAGLLPLPAAGTTAATSQAPAAGATSATAPASAGSTTAAGTTPPAPAQTAATTAPAPAATASTTATPAAAGPAAAAPAAAAPAPSTTVPASTATATSAGGASSPLG